jgi:hypothetical protein
LAVHPIGKEKEFVDYAVEMWSNFKKSNFYKGWTFGIAEGVMTQKGLWDSTPILEFIQRELNTFEKIERKFTFGIVDANSGKFTLIHRIKKING